MILKATNLSAIALVDPVGNVYIPRQLLKNCSDKCIETILLHEAYHLISRRDSNIVMSLIDNNKSAEGIKGILNKASKNLEKNIDILVIKNYKNNENMRNEYLNILEKIPY